MRRIAFVLAALALALPANTWAGSDHTFGSDSIPCGDDGTISWTPTTLWPPNHKLHDITFTYADPDGGNVDLAVTATDHSDIVGGEELNGSGNTDPGTDSLGGAGTDSDGSVDVVGNARAERSGHSKLGRTYSFDYVAMSDPDGIPASGDEDGCMGPDDDPATDDAILVFVPHDCRGGACKG
jgi:hypothetical protein